MEKTATTSLNSNNNSVESVTLSEWVSGHHSEDEMRSIFLNMDRALKYIHEHGYCIDVFYPTEINVLNNNDNYIQFRKLVELSKEYDIAKEMIKEDIFRSSLIQIGMYSNSLNHINPNFVKENFDSFAQFIPSDDVPYYRGVIQRGASVYLCEYTEEKSKRDIETLEKELGENEKNTDIPKSVDITNKKVNDMIYRQINGMSESAFTNVALVPIIILTIISIIMSIIMLINLIG